MRLKVVKLVRMLYLLMVQKVSLSALMETTINVELFSLLLVGYGATMS